MLSQSLTGRNKPQHRQSHIRTENIDKLKFRIIMKFQIYAFLYSKQIINWQEVLHFVILLDSYNIKSY